MKSIGHLLRITVLDYFHISKLQEKYFEKREKQWEIAVFGLSIVVLVGSVGGMVLSITRALLSILPPLFAEPVLLMFVLAAQVIALTVGIGSLFSLFFYSRDLQILLALPLQATAILAAKFTVAAITEYAPILVLIVPALLAFNERIPLGLWGVLSSLVVILLLPLIPLSIAGIATLTIMRGIGKRHRDLMVVLASVLILIVTLGLQFLMQSVAMDNLDLASIMQGRIDLVARMGAAFPPALWATRAIARAGETSGFVNLLYLVLATGAAVIAFFLVGQKAFYGGLIGGGELARQRTKLDAKALSTLHQSSVVRALLLREIRLFFRMPIWVLNAFIAIIILPLSAMFPAIARDTGIDGLRAVIAANPEALNPIILGGAAFFVFIVAINTVACTALSREGKNLWISKTIPVPPRAHIEAKLAFALLCTLGTGVIVAVTVAVMLAPGMGAILWAITLGFVASIAPQCLGLAFDLYRPFLAWTTPQHAVKNNLNAVSALVVAVPVILLSYYLYRWVLAPLDALAIPLLVALHSSLAAGSLYYLFTRATKFYEKIEVKD